MAYRRNAMFLAEAKSQAEDSRNKISGISSSQADYVLNDHTMQNCFHLTEQQISGNQ